MCTLKKNLSILVLCGAMGQLCSQQTPSYRAEKFNQLKLNTLIERVSRGESPEAVFKKIRQTMLVAAAEKNAALVGLLGHLLQQFAKTYGLEQELQIKKYGQ